MAGDWIKMRVSLPRDPKVIAMANWLAKQSGFIAFLSKDPIPIVCNVSNVTVSLCVTALLVTWGVARERGDRDGDDLILECCDLETLSSISGIPSFGQAMGFIGWAKEEKDQILRLSGFFKDHESPDEKFKRQNAERQARFRDKKSRNDSNVTITHREEKRRSTSSGPRKSASGNKSNGGTEPQKAANLSTWQSYSTAYFNRYGTEPLRNALANSLVANFCKAVPMEEAPAIAAFYVAHNKYSYVNSKHDLKIMLACASALHTDWKTGQQSTDSQARKLDQGQAQGSIWAKLNAEGKQP